MKGTPVVASHAHPLVSIMVSSTLVLASTLIVTVNGFGQVADGPQPTTVSE